jgi:hypothetical protein
MMLTRLPGTIDVIIVERTRGCVDYLPLPLTLGDLMDAELQGLQH